MGHRGNKLKIFNLLFESLVYAARERGGEDNITVILVEWESDKALMQA